MNNKRYLFILNPNSGEGLQIENILETIHEQLPGLKLDLVETNGQGDFTLIKSKLENNDYDGILVGGGDGTIKMVVEAILGTQLPIGIIPLGSANGLARCLGVTNMEEAISAILYSQIKSLDIMDINGHIGLHLSDFGFNAGMVKKFDEEDKRGMITYFKSTLKQFFEMKPYRFEIETLDKTLVIESKMLVIANGDKYGTGALINPTGKMDDGFIEIIAVNPSGFEEIAGMSVDMFKGKLDQSEHVTIWKVKEAKIRNLDHADFQIDGEVVPNTTEIKVTCKANQIRFFGHFPEEIDPTLP